MTETGPWKATLQPRFKLTRPDGVEVTFRTRKAAALASVLVLSNGRAHSRANLAGWLWSSRGREQQLTNLRQSLAHVREALEPYDVLETTRQSCRLVLPALELESEEAALLGEFGDLGDRALFHDAKSADDDFGAGAPGESFRQTLYWAARHRPATVLDLVHSLPDIAETISPHELDRLLQVGLAATPSSSAVYGWGLLHRAMALVYRGDPLAGITALRRVCRIGEEKRDVALLGEAIYTIGLLLPTLGRSNEAHALLRSGKALAGLAHALHGRLQHAEALAMATERDSAESDRLFAIANAALIETESVIDQGFRIVHRALTAWSAMPVMERELERAYHIAQQHGHWRLELSVLRAKSRYALLCDDTGQATEAARQAIQIAQDRSAPIGLASADELFAASVSRLNPELAKRHLRRSRQLRRQHSVPPTPCDRLIISKVTANIG